MLTSYLEQPRHDHKTCSWQDMTLICAVCMERQQLPVVQPLVMHANSYQLFSFECDSGNLASSTRNCTHSILSSSLP